MEKTGIKVLLIEDADFDREKMMRALNSDQKRQYQVKCLTTVEDIEQNIISWSPDLIILDLSLPGYNGLDLIRMLPKKRGEVAYPFIVTTGTGSEAIAVEAMKLGALDYIVKTILNSHSILEVIHRALGKHELQQQHIKQHELLRQSQLRLRMALNASNMGIWEWDIKANQLYCSSKTSSIMGFEEFQTDNDLEIEFQPRSFEEISLRVSSDILQELVEKITAAIDSKEDFSLEFPIDLGAENVQWVKIAGKADYDPLDKHLPVKFYGTCIDHTSHHLMKQNQESQLATSKSDLKSLKIERDMREQFVSTLSHDLRNPLTAAKMGTQLMLRHNDSTNFHNPLQQVVGNLDRVDRMIQDLLDANRIRAGQGVTLKIESCHLQKIVADCVSSLSLTHGSRFIVISVRDIMGFWDKHGMQRIFENLLVNAIKYGSLHSPVTITMTEVGGKVKIFIHNEGEALSLKEQELIFDPYHRAPSAQSKNVRGWGLGLTLVRGLSEAHGGSISLTSIPKEGTTFIIELPLDCR